jgi:putative ABC transport system substrate-binding protein
MRRREFISRVPAECSERICASGTRAPELGLARVLHILKAQVGQARLARPSARFAQGNIGLVSPPHRLALGPGSSLARRARSPGTRDLGRREFISLLAGAAAAWPLAARAQQPGRMYRVGLLAGGVSLTGTGSGPVVARGVPALLDELRRLGFSEGQNLTMDYRSTNQPPQRLAADVAEMVRARPDVIVTSGAEAQLQAVMPVSGLIPIVFWANNYDPIERGYVQSLARPGGNLTGVFTRQPELAEKQVELLAQTFPDRTRLGVLWDANTADQFSAAERRARLHAIKLEAPPYDFEAAFRALVAGSPQALLVLSGPAFAFHQGTIAGLALKYRLPGMFILRTYVDAGGLMSYGVDIEGSFRRVAHLVAKILNGAKPADLPIEQPVKYELVVNLKTARAIGIELPTSLLLRADEVIE